MKKLSLICFISISFANLAFSEEIEFDTLDISGSKLKNEEKPFISPEAISTREGLSGGTQSIDSIIRSIPGAYTQVDQAQGGVSVNIRGMTGLGRVNTQIDGVTQTFFGSASDDSFHGQIGTSSFSAPIDKNFLIGVDITRGTFKGASGANALMGSANFRTIGVDDVVRDGNTFGFLGKYSYGSNAIGPNFMGTVAAKTLLENGASVGFLFGYSGQNLSQNYKVGGGGYIGDQQPPFDSDDDGIPDTNLPAPINPKNLYNQPRSQLIKAEYQSELIKAILSYRGYHNNLAGRKITNDTYQLDYRFTPNSNLLDLKFLMAYNDGKQKYNQGSTWGYHDMSGVKTKNRALTLDLSNTMSKEISLESNFYLTYGLNLLNNHYSNDFPRDRVLLPYILTAFYPKGEQDIKTFYIDTSYTYGIFTLNSNINWLDADLSGYKGVCSIYNSYCQPKTAGNIEKNYKNFNYSFVFSANMHPLFNPFISYSKSHRIPNVQEYFFTHDAGFEHNMNTFLKQESANTYQIGFNSFTHGLLKDDDTFGLKVLYYDTSVKNYIYNRRYWQKADDAIFVMQLNDDEKAKFNGVELEFRYDMGVFYSTLSYTYQKSKHKFSDTESLETGGAQSGQSQFAQLPEHYANLDIGVRLLEEKLNIGAIAKYTGKAKRIAPIGSLEDDPSNPDAMAPLKTTDDLPKIPTIIDLYASYELFKNFNIKAEVQNLFDENYMDALYAYNTGDSQNAGGLFDPIFIYNNSARGRTFIVSFEYKY
ncbi:TonB-dependent receptor [Campylobacter sp. CCS1377]|uniref:TonB-dependent receptor n=1 Tax=Campylobacter sp. CCS1377 TaxID=3158229 RepID=A0AAU7E912_9BACT|nr:TonB-dependent receptor [Campylobacter jejuni]